MTRTSRKESTVENAAILENHNGVAAREAVERPIEAATLRARLQEMGGQLSNLRNQRDGLEQQLQETNTNIGRVEGAILMVQALLQEATASSAVPVPAGTPTGG